jgi:hypothetical protein
MIQEEKWDYQRVERIRNEVVRLNNEQMTSLYITHRILSLNCFMLLNLKGFAILGNYGWRIEGHFYEHFIQNFELSIEVVRRAYNTYCLQ